MHDDCLKQKRPQPCVISIILMPEFRFNRDSCLQIPAIMFSQTPLIQNILSEMHAIYNKCVGCSIRPLANKASPDGGHIFSPV